VGSILIFLAVADNGQAILGGLGLNTVFFVAAYATVLTALVRFGLLAAAVTSIVNAALTGAPFPAHLSSWAGASAIWTIVLLLGLMTFGFYSARAGQPLFGKLDG